jgi:hypothetical protein
MKTHRINLLDSIVLDLIPVNGNVSSRNQSLEEDESNSDRKGSHLSNLLRGVSRAVAHDASKAQLGQDWLELVNGTCHRVLVFNHGAFVLIPFWECRKLLNEKICVLRV